MQRLKRTLALHSYNEGIQLYEIELLPESLSKFYEAIKLYPKYSKFWESAAMVQIEMGEYQRALSLINKLFKFKKVNKDYLNVIKGDNLMRLGQYRKAFKCYCSVSTKNSHFSGVKARKIKYFMALSRYQDALKISVGYTNNFYVYGPSNLIKSCEEIYFLHGVCYFYLGRYSQAVKCLNRAAANMKYRNNPELLFYKGSSHYNIGQFQRAVISFQQLLAMGNSEEFGVQMVLQLSKLKVASQNLPRQNSISNKQNAELQEEYSQQISNSFQKFQRSENLEKQENQNIIVCNQISQKQMNRGKHLP